MIIETHLPILINPTRMLRLGIHDARFGFLDHDNLFETSIGFEIGVEIKSLALQPSIFRWTQFLTNGSSEQKRDDVFGFPDPDSLFQTSIGFEIGVEIKSLILQSSIF